MRRSNPERSRPGECNDPVAMDRANGRAPRSRQRELHATQHTERLQRHNLNGTFLSGYAERADKRTRPDLLAQRFRERSRARQEAIVHEFEAAADTDSSRAAQEIRRESAPPSRHQAELILGENNFLPFSFLRAGDRIGRSVVKIQRADGACGTGFIVAPGILLTNHHVLPDLITAATSAAVANYETSPPPDPLGRYAVVPLCPTDLFVTNAELDFTFCGVRGLDYLGCVALNRNSMNVLQSELVNIIQHPRGRPKEVALHDNRVVTADNVVVRYSCDTEPGSSGSPVFNNQWQLVALHHASVGVNSEEGRRAIDGMPNARYLNEGIRMSAIALWLETAEANTPEKREQVIRLRSHFGGVDPQAGFFGALGRRADGVSAPEIVCESYKASPNIVDVAFWDLSELATRCRQLCGELAWAIADLGADLWILRGLSKADLRALCTHLETRVHAPYRILAETDRKCAIPQAVVYRRSSIRSIRELSTADLRPEPSAGAGPMCVRIGVRSTTGERVPIHLALPCAAEATEHGVRNLVETIVKSPFGNSADWLMLGGDEVRLDGRALRELESRGVSIQAGRADRNRAFVLWNGSPTRIGEVFVSPGITLLSHPQPWLNVVHDRELPTSVLTLCERHPIALRIALTPRPVDRPPGTSAAQFTQNSLANTDSITELEHELQALLAELRSKRGDTPPQT